MRKGTILTEMLVALAITATVSVALSALFKTLLSDIPRSCRAFDTNYNIQIIIKHIRNDIDKAKSISQAPGDQSLLLLALPETTIAYRKNEDSLIRYTYNIDPNSTQYYENIWYEPKANIDWRLRERNGINYAVEFTTSVEFKTLGRIRNLLANSYIFFKNDFATADK